ncbi:hypothetical protein BX666DRAFT_2004117 [Dichotomocladium elegans]|nr:hypothetical protein BX666DRAFT_2004117 [Dichotomocladium elegans]
MTSPSTKQQQQQQQEQQRKKPRLLGSQDLMTYYNLIPIYDKFVRPYPPPDRATHLEQSLQSYIAHLPGKNVIEPDGFLFKLLRDPQIPDQGPPIRQLDPDVLRDAYTLRPGPIPGFDASILGTDKVSGGGAPFSLGHYHSLGLNAERDLHGVSAGEGDQNSERKHKKKVKIH